MAVPTELISAGLGAAGGGTVAWLTHRAQVARERTREIRDVLLKVADLRERQSELASKPLAQQPELGALLYPTRAIYLAIAEDLVQKAARQLTSQDYMILGYESLADSDWASARH